MLATRTAGMEILRPTTIRPSLIRIHKLNASSVEEHPAYEPALSLPQYAKVHQAIDALRQLDPEETTIYYLFVTDYEGHLVGVVSLWQLIVASPNTELIELTDRRIITLPYDASLEEQAHLMSETDLVALPVVDENGRLVGAMDTKDLITAIKDEATEQMYQLAGVCKQEHIDRPLPQAVRDRFLWLLVSVLGGFFIAWIASLFVETIAHAAMIAVFLPLVAGLCHSAGAQTVTFISRSLTLGQLNTDDFRRIFNREAVIGLINGAAIGTLVGILGATWQGSIALGSVIGLATMGYLVVAPVVGVAIPFCLKSLHLNPTRLSSVFVQTVTNAAGIVILLGLGTLGVHLGYL